LGDELLEDPRRRRLDKRDGRRSLVGGSKSVTCTTGDDAARCPACDVRDVVAERDSGGRELLLIRCQSSMRRLEMKTSACREGAESHTWAEAKKCSKCEYEPNKKGEKKKKKAVRVRRERKNGKWINGAKDNGERQRPEAALCGTLKERALGQ